MTNTSIKRTPLLRKLALQVCCVLFCIISTQAVWAQQRLVVITPHPDDAEASCGGLMANAVAAGDSVFIITMTGGELGIGGKTKTEARTIRQKEASAAADFLHARIIFFGAEDASLAVDTTNTKKLLAMLKELNPTIITAPWPMDVHPDHQATGLLAWRVFQDKQLRFSLYFYETTNSPHTKTFGFVPTDFVDITSVMSTKKSATLKHVSQHPEEWFGMYETLATVRGYEADVTYAEAYLRAQNSSGMGGRKNIPGKTLQQ